MKYFVVSDIHGCYTPFKRELDTKGFELGNPMHTVLVLGDSFDRGSENKEVYEFLMLLKENDQLIYVLGNHDLFFFDIPSRMNTVDFNIYHNGFDKTIHDLFDLYPSDEDFEEELLTRMYRLGIKEWLYTCPLYFETENYIFAHAGIPTEAKWRGLIDTRDLWTNTEQLFSYDLSDYIGDKTLVCGHWHAIKLRQGSGERGLSYYTPEHNTPYFSEDGQKIGIDGCTNSSGIVNVLVIEDELMGD
jgi:serine/threonine protein phosphatase 1